jgi:hypothetical protein
VKAGTAPPLLLLLALSFACPGRNRGDGHGDRAVLVVESRVADAVLWVDGRYVAQLRDIRAGVRLPPGRHQIELRHDSYHAYYGELTLGPTQRLRLTIELAEKLD